MVQVRKRKFLSPHLPLSLLAALLLGILAKEQWIDNSGFSALTRTEDFVFLSFFITYLYYSFSIAKRVEAFVLGMSSIVKP
jgi:cation:H+ antiporter